MSRRVDALVKYGVLGGVFLAALGGGLGVIFLQSWGDSSCPARSSPTAATRWTVALVTLVLVAYCAGAGTYLWRSLGQRKHLIAWAVPGVLILILGVWLTIWIEPVEFCF